MDDRSSAPRGHPGAQVPSLCCCYPLGRRLWQKLRTSIVSALRPPGRRRQGGEAHRASKLIPLAVPSCKGCWEMSYVAGQPRDQLMLASIKERRRPTGPGPATPTRPLTGQPATAEGAERPTYGAPLQCTPRPEESTVLEDPQPVSYKRPRLQRRLITNLQDSKKSK